MIWPMEQLPQIAISFIVGAVVGFLLRGVIPMKNVFEGKEVSVNNVILIMLFTAFFVSVIVDAFSTDYETPLALYGLMGIPIGFLFKPNVKITRDDEKKDER